MDMDSKAGLGSAEERIGLMRALADLRTGTEHLSFLIRSSPAVSASDLEALTGPLADAAQAAVRITGNHDPGDLQGQLAHSRLQDTGRQCRGAILALRDAAGQEEARSAETAWDLGTEHARAGETPYGHYSPDEHGCSYAEHAYEDARALDDLAADLGLPGKEHSSIPAASAAYADAYAEITGTGAGPDPLAYWPGQAVTTASGSQGTLTGDSTRAGHPVIRWDGETTPVARAAIPGPIAYRFGSGEEATRQAAQSSVIQSGDVLLIPSWPHALIKAGDGYGVILPSADAMASDHGRYQRSIALARDLLRARDREQPETDRSGKRPARERPRTAPGIRAGSEGRARPQH